MFKKIITDINKNIGDIFQDFEYLKAKLNPFNNLLGTKWGRCHATNK